VIDDGLQGSEAPVTDATVQREVGSTSLPKVPHQNWFAVALSEELALGQVIGVPFADGRLAMFRQSDGSVVALSARCAHMGADLAAGEVINDELRCMFHHFCYGADGVCTRIPSGATVPAGARVHSFPAAESVGLVWVFNGETPPVGPPQIIGYPDLAVRARRTDMFEVQPWVIITNSFDFAHLRYVHGLRFDFDDSTIDWGDREVRYEMTFTMPDGLVADQRIRVIGTNTVAYVTGGDVDSMGLFTSTPVGAGSQSYYVAAAPVDGSRSVEEQLQLQEHIADELLRDDTRAFANMRFQQGSLVAEDRSIVRYLSYVRSFPTNDPSPWLA
jgi:phenylpropionate dioxygenase-like ring-hydroxylating dioxygenase large terminal subunit